MNNNLTKLVFILDKSGSMWPLTKETIGGYNALIADQKTKEGECEVTTVLFSSSRQKLIDNLPIAEVPEMTNRDYVANGMTALLDAVGMTIDEVGQELATREEKDRPGKVIVIINTDGEENASMEYTASRIREMIEHQQNKYNWVFMFLGANINAEKVGSSYGIKSGYSKTYTASAANTDALYCAMSKGVSNLRGIDAEDWNTQSCTIDCTIAQMMDEVE